MPLKRHDLLQARLARTRSPSLACVSGRYRMAAVQRYLISRLDVDAVPAAAFVTMLILMRIELACVRLTRKLLLANGALNHIGRASILSRSRRCLCGSQWLGPLHRSRCRRCRWRYMQWASGRQLNLIARDEGLIGHARVADQSTR